ncbi:MAG: SRPBCC family protein [Dermatophilaceae bacterium]
MDLNTSTFAGRETQLTYVLQELASNQRIDLRGENKTVIAHDTMNFRAVASGTEVTYTAGFTFKGIALLFAPLPKPAFERLGNETETGMAEALARL